ncbi:MAG TPA: hypothetical protein VG737_12555 [Cyclobacteriaceae bacterium]|nr:hypothetical protein [Cyclobacteriaceae bacterium]
MSISRLKYLSPQKPSSETNAYFRITRVLAWLITSAIFYHFAVRPTLLNWGTPEKIQQLTLPGDKLCGENFYTRAVFIKAKPSEVWPWIMQLGQERGGFYSYSFLENLALARMKNVTELRAELQAPRTAGDTIWLAAKTSYYGMGYQILALVEPERSFVMTGGDDYERLRTGDRATGTWSIYLYPEGDGTWLIARSAYHENLGRYLFYEIPHFIMEEKMLRTIRGLAAH